mgnify:FL=1
MALIPQNARAAAEQPFDAATTMQTLDVGTTDTTFADLPAGAWEAFNTGSVHLVASLTGTTASMPPSSGAAAVTAFPIPAGGVASFVLYETTTLHAKQISGSGTVALYLTRKVL